MAESPDRPPFEVNLATVALSIFGATTVVALERVLRASPNTAFSTMTIGTVIATLLFSRQRLTGWKPSLWQALGFTWFLASTGAAGIVLATTRLWVFLVGVAFAALMVLGVVWEERKRQLREKAEPVEPPRPAGC